MHKIAIIASILLISLPAYSGEISSTVKRDKDSHASASSHYRNTHTLSNTKQGAELRMIELQSLMSQRQASSQMGNNMMENLSPVKPGKGCVICKNMGN